MVLDPLDCFPFESWQSDPGFKFFPTVVYHLNMLILSSSMCSHMHEWKREGTRGHQDKWMKTQREKHKVEMGHMKNGNA
jgi:hypothetical protein